MALAGRGLRAVPEAAGAGAGVPAGPRRPRPETKRLAQLRLAFEEWEDNQLGERPNPAIHRAWINFVLKQTLGCRDEVLAEGQDDSADAQGDVAEYGETLRPDSIVRNPRACPTREGPAAGPGLSRRRKTSKSRCSGGTGRRRRHPHDGTAPRHRRPARPRHQRRALDAGRRPEGRDDRLRLLVRDTWLEEPLTLRAFRTLLGRPPLLQRRRRRDAGSAARKTAPTTSRKSPTSWAIRSARRSRC